MNLRLLGAPTLRDVVPAMVDASNIHNHSVAVPDDRLYQKNCTPTFSYSVPLHLFIRFL